MKKFLSMTLAAVMCFCAFGCAPDTSNDGGMKTVDQILKETSAEDLKCEEYDLGKYTAPYYDSQIIYNETVMFVENDGAFAEKKLMYKPGKILEVRSYDLKTLYKENVDYTVTENGIMRTPNSSMPYLTEDDFYVDESGNANTAFASISREGQFCKYDEGIYFPFHQVAVTYIHTEEYYGPEVTASGKMSNVVAKLKNKENLTFVFYGDSLMAGCNSSGYIGYDPQMPKFSELITGALAEHYGYEGPGSYIDSINTAVGGWLSANGKAQFEQLVVDNNPDVLVLGFGCNDGTFGVTAEDYQKNMYDMVERIKQVNPDCAVVLMSNQNLNPDAKHPMTNEPFIRTQNEYPAVLDYIATGYEDVVHVNTTSMYYDFLLKRKEFRDLTASNMAHCGDFMCRAFAQWVIAEFIED